jgi:uncharacterized protein (TIGR02001 family)
MKTISWKAGLFGALAFITIAPAAFADDEGAWGGFTAGGALTSDYRFRGISNSDRDGAAQAWVQYDQSGFFGNIWASTIDFNDETTYDSTIEVDFTAGYNYSFSDETQAGIRAIYYWYADADAPTAAPDYDYFELAASGEHDFGMAAVSGEVTWSPDYFAEVGDAISVTGGVTVPVMETFAFFDGGLEASGHVGYQWIDDNVSAGVPDYLFYDVGATATWGVFAFDLRWVGTDVDRVDCAGGTTNCEGGVVLSVSADLPG